MILNVMWQQAHNRPLLPALLGYASAPPNVISLISLGLKQLIELCVSLSLQ